MPYISDTLVQGCKRKNDGIKPRTQNSVLLDESLRGILQRTLKAGGVNQTQGTVIARYVVPLFRNALLRGYGMKSIGHGEVGPVKERAELRVQLNTRLYLTFKHGLSYC